MWVVHKRIATLWFQHCYGEGLNKEEMGELKICLDAHMRKVQKLADLKNKSLMASMVNDTNWQHEICTKIDKIKIELYGS